MHAGALAAASATGADRSRGEACSGRGRERRGPPAGAHRCTKQSSAWCHTTGSVRSSRPKRTKWSTSASTTRYGSAYFLSSSTRMKKEVVPLYGISAIRSSAAAECSTGTDTRRSTDDTMTASRSVHVPDAHSGSSSPCRPPGRRRASGRRGGAARRGGARPSSPTAAGGRSSHERNLAHRRGRHVQGEPGACVRRRRSHARPSCGAPCKRRRACRRPSSWPGRAQSAGAGSRGCPGARAAAAPAPGSAAPAAR